MRKDCAVDTLHVGLKEEEAKHQEEKTYMQLTLSHWGTLLL
jgi:hypothetical protein